MFKADLHVHTKYSYDCKLEPSAILRVCQEKNIDCVAITDHNSIKGGLETICIKSPVKVIIGEEVNTDYGEIIGYKLKKEIKSRKVEDVISEIKDQGGLVSVPHSFDILRKNTIDKTILDRIFRKIDFIEGLNARTFWFFNNKAKEFARRNKISVIAGSDAHLSFEIGRCITILEDLEKMEPVSLLCSNVSKIYPAYPLLRTKIYKVFRK